MTDQLILQLIMTVSTFCSNYTMVRQECIKSVWTCGHAVSDSIAIISQTHNCIGSYVRGELK